MLARLLDLLRFAPRQDESSGGEAPAQRRSEAKLGADPDYDCNWLTHSASFGNGRYGSCDRERLISVPSRLLSARSRTVSCVGLAQTTPRTRLPR
jgi:hypothetical protein